MTSPALLRAAALLVLLSTLVPSLPGGWADAIGRTTEEQDTLDNELAEARGLLRLGRVEEGLSRLEALRAKYPRSARVVLLHGKYLLEQQKLDDAERLYREAASQVDDPALILMDLERVYREGKQWTRAVGVCLEYEERFGTRGAWVANELESLIRSDHLDAAALEAIEKAVEKRPDDPTLGDLWVFALFHAGHGSRALEAAQELDRARGAEGGVIMTLASFGAEGHRYDDALAAYDLALSLDLPPARRAEATYKRAQVLRKLRRLDESLAAYDDLLARDPAGPFARQARLDKAEILALELHRGDEAVAAYQDLIVTLGQTPRNRSAKEAADREVADKARLALADCQVRLGNPDAALRVYQALADSSRTPELRARALYECGEMLFYQGRLKEAEDGYYKLTDLYPNDRWVNDALERILLIGENRDSGSGPLQALAQAAYLRRLGQLEKGVSLVDEALRAYPKSRASDDLLLSRERLLFELGKIEPALSAADTLALQHGDSRLAPRGLLEAGLRLAAQENGTARAQQYLERVVVEFPRSVDARDARAALKDLKERANGVPSSPAIPATGGGG